MRFPAGFRWGVATAAYQIEGAVATGGRGPSIWDTFTAEPGRIADGSTGEVACDHYFRYADDVGLMAGPRRLLVPLLDRLAPDPAGRDRPANPRGLAFYDRLVDALLERGIEPVATLFHWDLPQPLQDSGGWLNRDTAQRFADYAELVAAALGDRIALWLTLNEPFVHMTIGHAHGGPRARAGAAASTRCRSRTTSLLGARAGGAGDPGTQHQPRGHREQLLAGAHHG